MHSKFLMFNKYLTSSSSLLGIKIKVTRYSTLSKKRGFKAFLMGRKKNFFLFNKVILSLCWNF